MEYWGLKSPRKESGDGNSPYLRREFCPPSDPGTKSSREQRRRSGPRTGSSRKPEGWTGRTAESSREGRGATGARAGFSREQRRRSERSGPATRERRRWSEPRAGSSRERPSWREPRAGSSRGRASTRSARWLGPRYFFEHRASLRLLHERDRERERRSDADLALDRDVPAVGLDDALDDVQPEPRACAARRALLPVTIEQVRKVFGLDAHARVADREADHGAGSLDADRDLAALGGELQRVAYEVREHLDHAAPLAWEQEGASQRGGAEPDPLLVGDRREDLHDLGDERVHVVRLQVELHALRLDRGGFEELVEQLRRVDRGALDALRAVTHRGSRRPHLARRSGLIEQGGRHQDRRDQVPEIVRGDGQRVLAPQPRPLLGLVEASALQRLRALLSERDHEAPILLADPAEVEIGEAERSDRSVEGRYRDDDPGLRPAGRGHIRVDGPNGRGGFEDEEAASTYAIREWQALGRRPSTEVLEHVLRIAGREEQLDRSALPRERDIARVRKERREPPREHRIGHLRRRQRARELRRDRLEALEPCLRQLDPDARGALGGEGPLSRLLGPLAVVDVVHDLDEIERRSRRIAHQRAIHGHPERQTVFSPAALVSRAGCDASRAQRARLPQRGLRVVRVQEILGAKGSDLAGSIPEHAAELRVCAEQATVKQDVGDPHGDLVQGHAASRCARDARGAWQSSIGRSAVSLLAERRDTAMRTMYFIPGLL